MPPSSSQTDIDLAVYSALANRFNTTDVLQWQIPSLALAAQAFLIAASASLGASLPAELALSAAILVVGLGSLLVKRRIEMTGFLDRPLLDHYEAELLRNSTLPPLLHASRAEMREVELRLVLGDAAVDAIVTPDGRLPLGWFNRLARQTKASQLWGVLQGVVTIVGVALPGLMRLPHG